MADTGSDTEDCRGGTDFPAFVPAQPIVFRTDALLTAIGGTLGEEFADRCIKMLGLMGVTDGARLLTYQEAGWLIAAAAPPLADRIPDQTLKLARVVLSTEDGARFRLSPEEAAQHPLLKDWLGRDLPGQFAALMASGALAVFASPSAPRWEKIELVNVQGWLAATVRLGFQGGSFQQPYIVTAELDFGPNRPAVRHEPEVDRETVVWDECAMRRIGAAARDLSDPEAPGELSNLIATRAILAERAGQTLQ